MSNYEILQKILTEIEIDPTVYYSEDDAAEIDKVVSIHLGEVEIGKIIIYNDASIFVDGEEDIDFVGSGPIGVEMAKKLVYDRILPALQPLMQLGP